MLGLLVLLDHFFTSDLAVLDSRNLLPNPEKQSEISEMPPGRRQSFFEDDESYLWGGKRKQMIACDSQLSPCKAVVARVLA